MFRRERRAAYSSIVLDEIDRRRKWAALERSMPSARHREPGALDRKQNRDHVPDRIANRRVGHYRPVAVPVFAVVKNAAKYQQIRKIRQVRELHEVIARRCRELLEPDSRMHAGEPVIEGDELGVLPARIYEVNERAKLLKAKQEK